MRRRMPRVPVIDTLRRARGGGEANSRLPVRLLFDGACPVCKHEAQMLLALDRGRRRLILEDISAAGFDPGRYGLTMDRVMAEIHAVLPDGRVVRGVEVFRRAYAAVGLGWLLAPTGWPVINRVADVAYAWFARNRLRLTGRGATCATGACRKA